MTTLQHDDVTTTAVEDAVAALEPDTPVGGRAHLTAVDDPARGDDTLHEDVTDPARSGAATPSEAAATAPPRRLALVRAVPAPTRPALRLVPTPGPDARRPVAPALQVPVPLHERLRDAAAARDLLEGPEEDRGAAPRTDAGRFAHGVGLACVEVVLGRRPVAQLARWVTPEVFEDLQVRADVVRRTGVLTHARRPAARRVRVCTIDAHTAEACLVVDDGVRVRALAVRLEAHRGAWRVATLQIG